MDPGVQDGFVGPKKAKLDVLFPSTDPRTNSSCTTG